MRRSIATILGLVFLSTTVRAEDVPPAPPAQPPAAAPPGPTARPPAKPVPPPTPEEAADAVLAAVRAKDGAALKALAAKDDPDPWLVADELIRRGEFDAAEAFSRGAPRVDVEGLPAYVASRRGKPDDAVRRARLAAINVALAAGKATEALDAVGALEAGSLEDVIGVRLAMGRGHALALLVRLEASSTAFLAAGDTADRLGWLIRADRAFGESGTLAHRASAFVAAREAWARELAVCERRLDAAGVARTLGNLGVVYKSLGDYAKALATYERSLSAKESLGDKAGAARTLGNIGNVYIALGDFPKAFSALERSLEASEALGDKWGAATTLGNLGAAHQAVGDYANTMTAYDRALAALEALGDKAGAARVLGNIGDVHYACGDYAKASSALERALAASEAMGDKSGAARTLNVVGAVCFAIGDYVKALSTFERALAASEALQDRRGAARTLNNVGAVYLAIGDYVKALSTFDRALTTSEASGDQPAAAKTLNNVGAVYLRIGDYVKALSSFERALAASEALQDKRGAARTLNNLGNLKAALGELETALAIHERALATSQASGDKLTVVTTLVTTGSDYALLGNFPRAIDIYERAVRMSEKLPANELLVQALQGLAVARLLSGDAGRAIESAHRAVSLLKTLVGGLGDGQGATARGQWAGLFATGLAAAAKADDVRQASFFLESGRAGTLLESLDARDALRHAAIPEPLRLAEATARAAEARALVAYTKAQDDGDLAVARTRERDLQTARARVEDVVERIQREAKKEAGLWYPVATPIDDIQGFLAEGDALVTYGLAEESGDAFALVLTKDEARIVNLGKSAPIVAACEALDPADPGADPAAAIATLRELVVKPLALPKETKRLLVSPEGPLSYVPFAALAPELVVAFESSGSTYGVLLEEKGKRGEQVLALADADYTAKFNPISLDLYAPLAAARDSATRGGRLVALPGTRDEATAVADVRLFGKDASEPGLRAALAKRKDRWHAVHFACHGLVNPARPTLSSLALTPAGDDDGFLTALEVLNLQIPSDLVVLSACETGKGKIASGEGIVGLTRAFMYAGAPRVICSLWKVDDEATRALMTEFYRVWNPKDGTPGLPTAEALRKAQAFVRDHPKHPAWKHPYYWAAWVLWGLPQ